MSNKIKENIPANLSSFCVIEILTYDIIVKLSILKYSVKDIYKFQMNSFKISDISRIENVSRSRMHKNVISRFLVL